MPINIPRKEEWQSRSHKNHVPRKKEKKKKTIGNQKRPRRLTIVLSSATVSSAYLPQPRRGINFGPVAFNADTLSKTFELKNEGEFEFVFTVQVRLRMLCAGGNTNNRDYRARGGHITQFHNAAD